MQIDPFLGVWIGLAGSVLGIVGVAWFVGLFDKPKDKHPHVPAE